VLFVLNKTCPLRLFEIIYSGEIVPLRTTRSFLPCQGKFGLNLTSNVWDMTSILFTVFCILIYVHCFPKSKIRYWAILFKIRTVRACYLLNVKILSISKTQLSLFGLFQPFTNRAKKSEIIANLYPQIAYSVKKH
jgi:hypothetical protein